MKSISEVTDEIMGFVATGRGIRGTVFGILADWREELLKRTYDNDYVAKLHDQIETMRPVLRDAEARAERAIELLTEIRDTDFVPHIEIAARVGTFLASRPAGGAIVHRAPCDRCGVPAASQCRDCGARSCAGCREECMGCWSCQ